MCPRENEYRVFTKKEMVAAMYRSVIACLRAVIRDLRQFIRSVVWNVREAVIRFRGVQQARHIQAQECIRLDLGCGMVKRAGYVGVDLLPGADIRWDVRWGLPFRDNSVAEIRSDHLFDRESIIAKVRLAGFSVVKTRDFDPARDVNYRFSSVYVVANK